MKSSHNRGEKGNFQQRENQSVSFHEIDYKITIFLLESFSCEKLFIR